jgi:hypothetical protein
LSPFTSFLKELDAYHSGFSNVFYRYLQPGFQLFLYPCITSPAGPECCASPGVTSELGTAAVPSSDETVATFSIGLRIAPDKRYSFCRIGKNPFLRFKTNGNGIATEKRRSTQEYGLFRAGRY